MAIPLLSRTNDIPSDTTHDYAPDTYESSHASLQLTTTDASHQRTNSNSSNNISNPSSSDNIEAPTIPTRKKQRNGTFTDEEVS